MDTKNVLNLTFTMTLLAFVGVHYLLPQITMLQEAKDALCAGERDFVYTIDGLGSPAWSYTEGMAPATPPTRPWINLSASDELLLNYPEYTLEKVLQGDMRNQGQPFDIELCPQADCYNGTVDGVPVAKPESERPGCCLGIQTKVPEIEAGIFSVTSKSKARARVVQFVLTTQLYRRADDAPSDRCGVVALVLVLVGDCHRHAEPLEPGLQ